jgi:regulatory protein
VLDRFTEVGLIDDEAFAQAWVDSRHASRALGRRALSAELRRRGVADDVVKEAVETVSADDEEAAARTLVEVKLRTMSNAPPEAKMRRLVGMLGRRGYSQGLALRVVRDVLADVSPRA